VNVGTVLVNAAAVLGLLTGITALVAFVKKQRADRAAEIESERREAEEEGRRKEREERMLAQIDAAHEKIRRLDARQTEQEQAVIEMRSDLKNAVRMLEKLDEKFDRYAERTR
jgi:uncharacterized protein HemX